LSLVYRNIFSGLTGACKIPNLREEETAVDRRRRRRRGEGK
jgi:hypothetical protein